MTRSPRAAIVFDFVIVLVFALFLWGPWERAAAAGAAGPSMCWLSLPMALGRHGVTLAFATALVTYSAVAAAALGALLAVAARMRGNTWLPALGTLLFGASVAILMPPGTALGFLGALLLIAALKARFTALPSVPAVVAILWELWPASYAIGLAALAWRYNPVLLVKALTVALGVALVARACAPAPPAAAPA